MFEVCRSVFAIFASLREIVMAWYRLPSPVLGPKPILCRRPEDFAGFRAQFVVFSCLGSFAPRPTSSERPTISQRVTRFGSVVSRGKSSLTSQRIRTKE
jgi:hypothetical protein